jgi:hypothetical protein
MIEVLKQWAEDVSKAYDVLAFAHTERALEILAKTRTSLRQAIAELESQESQIKTTDPFESAKVKDYNRGWNDCLFASGIVKQSQRIWQGLTDEEVKHEWEVWRANVPRYAGFAKGIEAKLKDKNCAG